MGENRVGACPHKSCVQILEISLKWIKTAPSLAVGTHSGNSWDTKTWLIRDLPCPRDKGCGKTDLKLYCLGKYCQKHCPLPLLLSPLPSSPRRWPRAEQFLSALSCPSPMLAQSTGPAEHVGNAPLAVWEQVWVWVTERGVFCPISHAITESLRFIVLGLPELKSCPRRLHVLQMFRLWYFFRSLVCVTFSSSLSFDHHQNRKKGLVFFLLLLFFLFFLMTIVTWYLELSESHTVCCRSWFNDVTPLHRK